jgi:FdhE protein
VIASGTAFAEAIPVRLPDPARLFAARAARLRELAADHPAPDFLALLARVADGQAAAVRDVRPAPIRAPGDGPPLSAESLPRDGAWRRMLRTVLEAARAPGLPAATQDALRALADASVADLEELAGEVLAGEIAAGRLASAPFVGAALEAWFASLAARLEPAALGRGADACPACGSPPVAGIVRGEDRLRYLACALCATEWNVPRLQCTLCGKDADLSYLHVDGQRGADAEACGRCRAYVKLFDLEKRPGAEAVADDAATIALDLLLGEDGWRRAGVNLYLAAAVAG